MEKKILRTIKKYRNGIEFVENEKFKSRSTYFEVISPAENNQKLFISKDHRPKIKHDTICNFYEKRGLRKVDINHKIKIIWIQKIYDGIAHK